MPTSIITSCPCCGDPELGYVWFSDGGDVDWVAPCPECFGDGKLEFTSGELDAIVEVTHPTFGRGHLCQHRCSDSMFFVDDDNTAWLVNPRKLIIPFTRIWQPVVTPSVTLGDAA